MVNVKNSIVGGKYGKYCDTLEEAIQERLKLEQKFCGEFSPNIMQREERQK